MILILIVALCHIQNTIQHTNFNLTIEKDMMINFNKSNRLNDVNNKQDNVKIESEIEEMNKFVGNLKSNVDRIEVLETAGSSNYVYRPLFVYRKIEHSKRRITMYNAFADNSILKTTKNVTQNPQMEENLYQISKDLVSAILTKLEIQDKITRITREALDAPGKNKGITAIETRRILDYISRTLSGHILSITRASTEPELHRLVYGLAQIAAEVSIVSALKDITYATALSKKQSVDLFLRKKRAISLKDENSTTSSPFDSTPTIFNIILKKPLSSTPTETSTLQPKEINIYIPSAPYSVISSGDKKPIHVIALNQNPFAVKGFLNQTVLDRENRDRAINETEVIVLDKNINGTNYITSNSDTINKQESNTGRLIDDWMDPKDNIYALNPDVVAEMEIEHSEIDEEIANEKKEKLKMEKLELKAKKAILYAGDVAYLTAASVVAMRRALTASIEVQMSVKFAKNGMSNHQDLMMNLAKTAAQQAGKEAKSATSKSLACERVIKLAVKYTAQSQGAKLNHVANRIIMDTLSLATLAKSMAFVSSDIAINSLYQATDIKPPS
ncbi:unnamed protein product [Parnassius apollo]|uniref:(apollo) hypothetical protein n=1 Tax=Parnassius apollo TaxID=110799 RepID=A0A8S3Y199_PARAO|nr:unnamed protein product [Parnassius apollo]